MRGVLGHTEINVSHYIHRTNRPQTSRLINIRPGRMCSVYRDYFLRRLVTSADTWREDWSISCWSKHSGTQLLCYWTEVFVFWQRSHLDIYFMFNTWFLILNTGLFLCSFWTLRSMTVLLIIHCEYSQEQWVLNSINSTNENRILFLKTSRYISVIMKSNTRLCAVNPPPSFYRGFLLCIKSRT